MPKTKKTSEQTWDTKYKVCKAVCKIGVIICVAAVAVATFASVATSLLPGLVSMTLGAVGVSFSADVRTITTLDLALTVCSCMFEGVGLGILWYAAMKQVNRFFGWLFGGILKKFQKEEN